MYYPLFARLFPFYTRAIEKLTVYADMKRDPREHANFVIMLSISLAIITFVAVLIFWTWYFAIISFFFIFALVMLVFYLLLMLKADKRSSDAEKILPDALQLMATNLRAGLTTDKAFLVSAREEFGVLNDEFKKVAKEIATGKDLVDALNEMSRRFKSNIIGRTIDLITFGITSGGELAPLLEESASSLRQQLLTSKQIHASVMMYTIFIFAAVGLISPLLFGLSTALTEIMSNSLASIEAIPADVASKAPLAISGVIISVPFVRGFSIVLLIVSSILSSLVLGLINSGEEKDGLKYIPVLIVLSLIIYLIVGVVIKAVLSAFVS